MKSFRKVAGEAAMLTALTFGCTVGEQAESHYVIDRTDAFEAFNDIGLLVDRVSTGEAAIEDYWLTQNIDVSQTEVNIRDVSGVEVCEPRSSAHVCENEFPPVVEINVEKLTFFAIAMLGRYERDEALSIMTTTQAHEYAHIAQLAMGLLDRPYQQIELEADCITGATLPWLPYDIDYAIVADFLLSIGDENHGTGEQRLEAFYYGLSGGDCWNMQ